MLDRKGLPWHHLVIGGYPGWDSLLSNYKYPKREGVVQVVTYPHTFPATLLSLGRDVDCL